MNAHLCISRCNAIFVDQTSKGCSKSKQTRNVKIIMRMQIFNEGYQKVFKMSSYTLDMVCTFRVTCNLK